MTASSPLRPITPSDHAAVLRWNAENVELLAPLDQARLDELLGWSDTAAMILHDGRDAGFVLTLKAGTAYDSDNYRWFSDRHQHFAYLDRVVIDPTIRRAGLGTRVYDELEQHAALAGAPVFCLEVNVDPPNEPSLAFHRNRGYVEVGRQPAGDHLVALFEKRLA